MTDRTGAGSADEDTTGKQRRTAVAGTGPAKRPERPERPEQSGAAGRPGAAPGADEDRGPLPSWFPAALVGLGVVVLAATVRTAGGLDRGVGDGPLSGPRILVVFPMVVVLAWVAVAFSRRRDPGFGVVNRAGAATVTLIVTIAGLFSVGLLLFGRKPPRPLLDNGDAQQVTSMITSSVHVTPTITPKVRPGDNSAALPLGLLFTAVILFMAAIAVLSLVRAIRRPRLPGGASSTPFAPLDEAEELAEAVEAGSQALEEEGDAREAVIACYAAMEQAVQGFGFARPLADTPEDLLRRATEKGLVPGAPATRLTELFREARFSRHVITETQRAAARDALTEIAAYIRALQAELAEPATTAAASGPAGGGPAREGGAG